MASNHMYEKYPLYMKVMALTLFFFSLLWGSLQVLLFPGLSNIHLAFAYTIEIILILIPCFFWSMWIVLFIATTGKMNIHPVLLRISNRSLYAFFPIAIFIGKLMRISKDRISQGLIDLINHLVKNNVYRVEPERILLLTPHCLQKNTCVHKVTTDVNNCKQCGQCQVGALLEIAQTYGCKFVVVTGGTLARMMVKAARPKAIIAIACERDLVSGMQDVFPVPVIGVLNERPCGPCCNTRVDIDEIKKVVEQLIYGKTERRS